MTQRLKRLLSRFPDLGDVFARFPVPSLLMGVFTLIVMWAIQTNPGDEEQIMRLLCGIVLAGYATVIWQVISENGSIPRTLIGQCGLAALLVLLSVFSDPLRFMIPVAIGGLILWLGNAARGRLGRDDLHVWDFTHKLWTGVIFAVAGSVIFLLGLLAIMAALKSLFGIDIDELLADWFLPVGFGFLAPLYWMSTIPPVDEPVSDLTDNPGFISKAVSFLGTWLLSPLILIYAAILLAYAIKIIMAGSLPKGEIAELTVPFLMIGTLNWLVLEPPFVGKHLLARTFRRVWFWLCLPVSLLLALAVWERVRIYGLTPERVLLMLVVVWALVTALRYTLLKSERRDIRHIPGLAAILLVGAAFVAEPLSVKSQEGRLKHNLKKAGIIAADGSFVTPTDIKDHDAAARAVGALRYLENQDAHRAVRKVLVRAGRSEADSPLKDGEARKLLGLDDIQENGRLNGTYYHFNDRERDHGVFIAGYDYLFPDIHLNSGGRNTRVAKTEDFTLSWADNVLTVKGAEGDLRTVDLAAWIYALDVKEDQLLLPDTTMVLYEAGDRKIILRVFNANRFVNPSSESERNFFVSGHILTRGFED